MLETNHTSAELLVPLEEGYLVEIRTVSDGGDGSSSDEIRIPKVSSERAAASVRGWGSGQRGQGPGAAKRQSFA